jgi:curved DNA-binding protein CbpA
MEGSMFTDFYEILEISPNATSETIERMFRHLAMRYHPDNPSTGDRTRFDEIVEAHNTLRDPIERVQYDIQHKNRLASSLELAEEASNTNGFGRDVVIQDKFLSILYVKRRQDMKEPGIGEYELERLSGCPGEHLQFHLWYLKAKGWIAKMEDGTLAITIEGVDRANSKHHSKNTTKLLMHPNHADMSPHRQ